MAMELITGYAGEGHVSSADMGRFNAGVCGTGKYVMRTGTMFEAEVVSNNLIEIGSGDAVDQGRHIIIKQNTVEQATIANGSQGKRRIDVIALKYEKAAGTGIESASLIVIQGTQVTAPENPSVPSVTEGNIFNGATVDHMPLYHVRIEGTSIESVTPVFGMIPSLAAIADYIYPVGSIYISTDGTNPASKFGGVWEEIEGKFLLGKSSGRSAGSVGGAEAVTLQVANLPSHTHTGPSHTHTIASHSHTATCASNGAHKHKVDRHKIAASGTARYAAQAGGDGHNSESAGAHTHTITVASGGGGNTGASGTGSTGATGSGTPVSIMPPYLTVYMFKRIS